MLFLEEHYVHYLKKLKLIRSTRLHIIWFNGWEMQKFLQARAWGKKYWFMLSLPIYALYMYVDMIMQGNFRRNRWQNIYSNLSPIPKSCCKRLFFSPLLLITPGWLRNDSNLPCQRILPQTSLHDDLKLSQLMHPDHLQAQPVGKHSLKGKYNATDVSNTSWWERSCS